LIRTNAISADILADGDDHPTLKWELGRANLKIYLAWLLGNVRGVDMNNSDPKVIKRENKVSWL